MSNSRRYIVKRFREREAAPSLSLSYVVEPGGVERDALIAHLAAYGPARDGERFAVCKPGERFGVMFSPNPSPEAVKLGNALPMNSRGYAPDRRRRPRVR